MRVMGKWHRVSAVFNDVMDSAGKACGGTCPG